MIDWPGQVSIRARQAFWLLAVALVASNAVAALHWSRWTGDVVPEWPLGVDLLLVLPLCYAWVHRSQGRQAWLGAGALFGLGVLLGSWLLPEASKQAWRWLEAFRLPVLAIVVGLQAWLILAVVRRAWRQTAGGPLEIALAEGLQQRLGAHATTRLLMIEARLWIYALLRRPVRGPFPGVQHFSVHQQGGNASNQQAFLIIVAAEIPLLHALLHFAWSPLAALVVTTLSVYGWVFLWAEYRATWLRPISLEPRQLHIRHGLLGDVIVPLGAIVAVERVRGPVRRAARRLRYIGMGTANLRLALAPGTRLQTAFQHVEVDEIFLGVDDPAGVRAALGARPAPCTIDGSP